MCAFLAIIVVGCKPAMFTIMLLFISASTYAFLTALISAIVLLWRWRYDRNLERQIENAEEGELVMASAMGPEELARQGLVEALEALEEDLEESIQGSDAAPVEDTNQRNADEDEALGADGKNEAPVVPEDLDDAADDPPKPVVRHSTTDKPKSMEWHALYHRGGSNE